ncbi:MAG TPA: alpha-galactosidase [Anaerolineales bacterium]|nr:alpha-galactosidase [Anaerolineales bacterium]
MIHTLESPFYQLEIRTNPARWSVTLPHQAGSSLKDLQVGLSYRRGRSRHHLLDRWPGVAVSDPETVPSSHGLLRQQSLAIEQDSLRASLIFALPQEIPLMFWRLEVENRGSTPLNIDRLEMLSAGFIYQDRPGSTGSVSFSQNHLRAGPGKVRSASGLAEDLAFFSNGWQSWSYSGVYSASDRTQRTRLGPFREPMNSLAGAPRPWRSGLFNSDMFGVLGDRGQRQAILLGFLSQKQHFGSIEVVTRLSPPALRLWANGDGAQLDPGENMQTDWACVYFFHLDTSDPLAPYLEAVARENGITEHAGGPAGSPTGWCSWYQFSAEGYTGGRLTAGDIRANLAALESIHTDLPVEVIQIDDGFETRVGDWFSFSKGFPGGIAPLAAEIRSAGFTPGLWLAPFIVHPKSSLAAGHPEWLLRNRLGRPVNGGYLWKSFSTALDLTRPEALAYVEDVIQRAVHEWGFPYLKLDFLYAAALPGRFFDRTRTRAQVLRRGLEVIRQAAGEQAFLVGCGCPLGPAVGLVDAMRIGADTAKHWAPSFGKIDRLIQGEPNLPAARNASHNALTRAFLHRRWWINDPDCLLLRPTTRLTLAEVQALATVAAMTGGSLLLSDHLPDLPAERVRLAQALLPLIGKRPHVLDWFENGRPQRLQVDLSGAVGFWHLLALFNWENKPSDLELDLKDFFIDPRLDYFARDFWSGQTSQVSSKGDTPGRLLFEQVPVHGVILLACRPTRPYLPQYLGSDLHISQGLEVAEWQADPEGVQLRLERPGNSCGSIELALPKSPQVVRLGDREALWETSGPGRCRIPVDFERSLKVELRC